jgi:hypothetical protein
MSFKRGLLRAADQQLQATAGRRGAQAGAPPSTQRGLPRVNVPTTPPSTSSSQGGGSRPSEWHYDSGPESSRRDTAPQAPRAGVRLRALTPPPRDTLPFSLDPEATLSYDGQALARGFDYDARRQSTMPLSSQELARLGVAVDPASSQSLSQRDTLPVSLAAPNVVQLPSARRSGASGADLDLGLARHENDPLRQSALLELSGIRRTSPIPWIVAGLGVGIGALGVVLALI